MQKPLTLLWLILSLTLGIGCTSSDENHPGQETCIPEELTTFRNHLFQNVRYKVRDSFCQRNEFVAGVDFSADSTTTYMFSGYTVKIEKYQPLIQLGFYDLKSHEDLMKLLQAFQSNGVVKSPMILMEDGKRIFSLSTQAQMNKGALDKLFVQLEPAITGKYERIKVIRLNM